MSAWWFRSLVELAYDQFGSRVLEKILSTLQQHEDMIDQLVENEHDQSNNNNNRDDGDDNDADEEDMRRKYRITQTSTELWREIVRELSCADENDTAGRGWIDMVYDSQATHIVRRLASVLVPLPPDLSKGGLVAQTALESLTPSVAKPEQQLALGAIFKTIVRQIIESTREVLTEMAFHACASPTLGVIVQALEYLRRFEAVPMIKKMRAKQPASKRSKDPSALELLDVILNLFFAEELQAAFTQGASESGQDQDDDNDDEDDDDDDEGASRKRKSKHQRAKKQPRKGDQRASASRIMAMAKDKVASHLFETLLMSISDDMFEAMFQTRFRGRLVALTLHTASNFVVQAFVSGSRTKEQAESVRNDCCTPGSDLLSLSLSLMRIRVAESIGAAATHQGVLWLDACRYRAAHGRGGCQALDHAEGPVRRAAREPPGGARRARRRRQVQLCYCAAATRGHTRTAEAQGRKAEARIEYVSLMSVTGKPSC